MSTAPKTNGAAAASSFWAKNASTVKTATTPHPSITEPPTPKEAAAAAKQGLVLKGMANGTTPNPRKTNWADSDDDEEFFANLKGGKNPRITALESTVVQKDVEIEALNAVIGSKDARIQELDDVIVEKDLEIGALEADKNEKATIVEQHKEENHKQFLYVQELVAEVDEKSRRVQDLEADLDVKGARIRDLEMQTKPDVPSPVSSKQSLPATPKSESEPEPVQQKSPSTPTKDAEPVPETPAKQTPAPTAEKASEEVSPHKDAAGPAINESKFPTLWSPDKPKKVVPPVERPKTLVMAIDTSKYGKKAAPVVIPKKAGPASDKGSHPSYGQSTKNRVKSDVVPPFAPDKDIRQMTHTQRVLYANGPDVTVMMGDKKLLTLPKYVLMQCSGKAYQYFTEDTTATSMVFPAGSMDADSAIAHLNWMVEMTYQGRVYSLTLNGDDKFNLKNLKICQAARVMGLNNTYVGHFTKILCDRVRSNASSPDFLKAICEYAYPENDPIFECLANNLVNQQGSKAFTRAEELEELLVKFPLLNEKMAKIEVRVKNARAGEKRKGGGPREDSKHRDGRKEMPEPEKKPAVVRGG